MEESDGVEISKTPIRQTLDTDELSYLSRVYIVCVT